MSEVSMVERVAAVLMGHDCELSHHRAESLARAAILAMREPTEEMLKAAHLTVVRENCGLEYSMVVGHRAMIDTALKE